MKQIKGFICGLLVGTIGITTVLASGGIKSAVYNTNKVVFNGQELNLNGQQMISVLKDGDSNASNYMPVRGILEAMGYSVSWDSFRNAVIVSSRVESNFINVNKSEEYNNWLNDEKKIIDEIGDKFLKLNNKMSIEGECVKLIKDGLDFEALYIGFSDNTSVFSDGWIPTEDWKPTERLWYKQAMSANSKAVSTELYTDAYTGKTMVTFAKNIGKIEGLDAVLGADVYVPDRFLEIK